MEVIGVIDKVSLGTGILSAKVEIVGRVVAAYNEGMRCHLLTWRVMFCSLLCAGFDKGHISRYQSTRQRSGNRGNTTKSGVNDYHPSHEELVVKRWTVIIAGGGSYAGMSAK